MRLTSLRLLLATGKPFLFGLFSLCLAQSVAHAQSTETSQEDARKFYSTTTVGLLIGLPLTILNNAAGNPADDSAMALSSASTNLVELTGLSSSTSGAHIEAARLFAQQNQASLATEIAMGGGPVLRELLVTLGLTPAVLDSAVRRARLRGGHMLLLGELSRLGAREENLFLEVLFRALYMPEAALTP
jgi:hypothetical protein